MELFRSKNQSWILSFCFEGSELAIIGRLFSIRLLLVYPRTRPSKTSSCRWECTSSSTRQKVFAIWDKQNAIQHLLDYFCVISCTERVVCTSLAETQEYSKGLKKIGKDWKGFMLSTWRQLLVRLCNFVPRNQVCGRSSWTNSCCWN